MNTWKSLALVMTVLCAALTSGCGVVTRLAVKNSGEAAIDEEAPGCIEDAQAGLARLLRSQD